MSSPPSSTRRTGSSASNSPGGTDLSLVREFFSFHQIPPTTQYLERCFDRYVFWLEHILQESRTTVWPGVWEFIRGLQALPQPPVLGLLTRNIRLGEESSCATRTCGMSSRRAPSPTITRIQTGSPPSRAGGAAVSRKGVVGRRGARHRGHSTGRALRPGHRREVPGGRHRRPSARGTRAASAGLGRAGFGSHHGR